MNVRKLLCLFGLLLALPAAAQTFRLDEVQPHTVIIKYKPAGEKMAAIWYRPAQILPPETQERLGIVAHLPMYDAQHPIAQASSNPRWGERCKQLGLIHILTLAPDKDLAQTIKALRKMPELAYAEPLYTNHKPLYVPNDPQANPSSAPPAYHLKTIKAYEAWDVQQGNANIVIGISDNEFNLSLADLTGQDIAPSGVNRDVADGDNILSATGLQHGTHVATVAVGKANNGVGSAGVCFGCKMMPTKVARDASLATYTHGYEGTLLAAAAPNCKVVNMSWGRRGLPSMYELDFLQTIVQDFDVVLVAAAGNDGATTSPTGLFFPASYNEVVLSVAATNAVDLKADFSTYNAYVDLCAPGASIVAQSGTDSGTSFASPIVAGAAALVRAQYPALNARQVRARLVSTTDNIYNLAGNAGFVGGLGSGRLNVYRAVTDPLMAVSMESYTFASGKRNHLFRGMTSDLVLQVRNHLNAVSNLQATLSTDSPYLTITDGSAAFGAIGANAVGNNASDVFKVQVSNTVAANTPALLTLTYQEGSFTYTEKFYILLNPGLANFNKLNLSHDDKGFLGVSNQLLYELNGMQQSTENFFTEAGLVLATDAQKVSSTVRSDVGFFSSSFTAIGTNNETSSGTLLTTTAQFEDITNNDDRIGLQVEQRTYSWNEPALENAIVVEYRIKNIAYNGTIGNLYAGIFTNWDIGNYTKNLVAWDEANALGYCFEAVVNPLMGGITCLTERDASATAQKLHYYALEENPTAGQGIINAFDGFTKGEKFASVSGGIARQTGGSPAGKDVANILAARLSDIKLGETRVLAFAYVLADRTDSLKKRAENIYQRYKQFKTSPTPTVANISTCRGGSVTVTPTGGSKFNFYAENPVSTTPILATGSQMSVTNVVMGQKIWVACVDSVFISPAVSLNIDVVTHETTFTQPDDSLNLAKNTQMTFTSTAVGAVLYQWTITRAGGAPNGDVVYSGSNALPAPAVTFSKNGRYTIRLVTENSTACRDTLTTTLFVYTDVTSALEEWLQANVRVFPNPTQDICQIAIPEIQENIALSVFDGAGKRIKRLAYTNTPEKPFALDLKDLPAGVYTLELRLKRGTWRAKVVRE